MSHYKFKGTYMKKHTVFYGWMTRTMLYATTCLVIAGPALAQTTTGGGQVTDQSAEQITNDINTQSSEISDTLTKLHNNTNLEEYIACGDLGLFYVPPKTSQPNGCASYSDLQGPTGNQGAPGTAQINWTQLAPAGQGCCFLAGTLVTTADGAQIPIEQVATGDTLLGEDGTTNTVQKVIMARLGARALYAFNGGAAFITDDHPVLTKDGWKAIRPEVSYDLHKIHSTKLMVGDEIIQSDGSTLKLAQISGYADDADLPLYNFTMNGNHTYTANNLVVHNGCEAVGVSASGDGGGGGGGGACLLCGELYRRGDMPAYVYAADLMFTRRHADPYAIVAYHTWARPLVGLMQQHDWVAALVRPGVMAWAEHMAFRLRAASRDNWIGRLMMAAVYPLHQVAGRMLVHVFGFNLPPETRNEPRGAADLLPTHMWQQFLTA